MLRRASCLLLVFIAVACERVETPPPAPAAEFIVAAGDSAFWVRSDADGIRVRGAPMVLSLVSGRFAELYVADDDQSFYDAVYVGQKLYKRDIISGDSMPLVSDTLMRLLARGYATANPDERPLAFDEQGSESPRTIASAEILVLDVMGPWISYEYRTDVDIVGGSSSHGLRHGVVDTRTGATTTLDALFGREQARAVMAEGQRQWREIRDSLAVAAPDDDELRGDLERLSFDARSFRLEAAAGEPHVRFAIAQSGARLAAAAQQLFPVPAGSPIWWEGVRDAYPAVEAAAEQRWTRNDVSVVARVVEEGHSPRVSIALRDVGGQEWPLGFVPVPIQRIMWLDDPALVAGTREALVRAFDDASLYSEDTRVARGPRLRAHSPRAFHFAAFMPRVPSIPRRIPPTRARH